MQEIPVFTVVIVTIAALLYTAKEVNAFIERRFARTVAKRLQELDNLHDASESEIRESFDFWWSGEPSKAARLAIPSKLPVPREELDQLPSEMLEPMIQDALSQYRRTAHHVAVHAHILGSEMTLIRKLPKRGGLRERFIERREQHEEDLNGERKDLLEVGVNVDELEKHFAPKS